MAEVDLAVSPSLYVPADLYINRELSWLAFNWRVLKEAEDLENPLLERVKFLAIFSSNLDEFFMIRVANLKNKVTAGITEPSVDGTTPQMLAARVRTETQRMLEHQVAIYHDQIVPDLVEAGIEIVAVSDVSPDARRELATIFEREIFPVLTPQAIDRGLRFPHVSNQSLNLLVRMHAEDGAPRYARVKVPAVISRLVHVPDASEDTRQYVWLEDLVASEIGRLFAGYQVEAVHPFHVNRDSDIEIDDADDLAMDLLNIMERQLSQRTFGTVTQLIVKGDMPADVRAWLIEQLHASETDLYVVDGPLAMEGLYALTRLDRPDLLDQPLIPGPVLVSLPNTPDKADWTEADVFEAVREKDVFFHHPYQSFGAVARFLAGASRDPHVVAIKQTLYRLGKDSPIIPALIEARDDDTQVAVLMEVKARFDEENNIALAHTLETAGVHVNYGLPGLKTHCKAMLIVRREPDGLRRYVHLSTGNYNAATARIYEDIGIITANEDLAADVSELFNVLTGYSTQEDYRALLVAPRELRDDVIELIHREIDVHRESGNGRIIFKMNSLVDRQVIQALYQASMAGVEIDLIIRGICCLRPGVPGWSESIRVKSIVGRFLEHSRVYYFRNCGNSTVYLGSADMMERNLDRRVEILFPIADEDHKSRIIDEILPAYLRDTVNSHRLLPDGTYQRVAEQTDATEPFDVHRWLVEFYRRS
jgi:polyphosphate kinase